MMAGLVVERDWSVWLMGACLVLVCSCCRAVSVTSGVPLAGRAAHDQKRVEIYAINRLKVRVWKEPRLICDVDVVLCWCR